MRRARGPRGVQASMGRGSCDRRFILSARHGLLDADVVLELYEQTLTSARPAERTRWATLVLSQLESRLGELSSFMFELHAGSAYTNHGLLDGLRARGALV